MDHGTLLNGHLQGCGFLDGLLPSSFHDLVDPTLTDLHPEQIQQGFLGAFIAHVLLWAVIPHRGFQSGSEGSLHLQPTRRRLYLGLLAIRTNYFVLPYFNHLCFGFRQFRDLIDLDQPARLSAQICMAVAAFLRHHMDHFIRLRYELSLVFLMPQWWTMPAFAPSFGLITLLILGRRLRRILRRGRRLLLVLLELQLQRFKVRLKFGKLLS